VAEREGRGKKGEGVSFKFISARSKKKKGGRGMSPYLTPVARRESWKGGGLFRKRGEDTREQGVLSFDTKRLDGEKSR